jgi:CheY-like chemotaxis protein
MTVRADVPILVAEDDPNDQFFIKRAFAEIGLTGPINCVSTGREAIEFLGASGQHLDRETAEYPLLILTDLKMPQSDGFELLTWVRKHPLYAVIPTVVLSSSILDADLRRAYDLGASACLEKPSGYPELRSMLHNLIEFWRMVKVPTPIVKPAS